MRLYYIDALKGIGALVVFFSHINGMLGVVDLPQYLNFFINGEFAVTMFLILSGFSISLSLNKNKPVSNFIIGRFFRFALPMAIAGTFAYTLYLLGLYRNHFVTESLGNWFAKNEYSDISIGSYIASLLWSPVGCTSLNNPLWMMKYIFWGSYIVLILHLATSCLSSSRKIIVYIISMLLLYQESNYYLCVVLGKVIYDFYQIAITFNGGNCVKNAGSLVLIAFGYTMACFYSRDGFTLTTHSQIMIILGAVSLIIGIVLSPQVRQILSNRLSVWVGSLSFEIYLYHFMIMCSFSCWIWIWLPKGEVWMWLNVLLTTIVLMVISKTVKKYVHDTLLKKVNHKISLFFSI